jgi:hypothetical protein
VDQLPLFKIVLGGLLCSVMEDTELGNEVSGILSSVDSQNLGDYEEGLRELGDSELFAAA